MGILRAAKSPKNGMARCVAEKQRRSGGIGQPDAFPPQRGGGMLPWVEQRGGFAARRGTRGNGVRLTIPPRRGGGSAGSPKNCASLLDAFPSPRQGERREQRACAITR